MRVQGVLMHVYPLYSNVLRNAVLLPEGRLSTEFKFLATPRLREILSTPAPFTLGKKPRIAAPIFPFVPGSVSHTKFVCTGEVRVFLPHISRQFQLGLS